jgi:hypothetical protein
MRFPHQKATCVKPGWLPKTFSSAHVLAFPGNDINSPSGIIVRSTFEAIFPNGSSYELPKMVCSEMQNTPRYGKFNGTMVSWTIVWLLRSHFSGQFHSICMFGLVLFPACVYIYIHIIIHIYINVFMYIYTYIHTDCINKYWHIVWMCIYYPSFSDYGWIHTPWYAHCVIVEPTFWVCLTGYSQYIPIVFLWINILQIHTYFYSHPNIHTLIPIGTVKSTFWHEEICYT